MTDITRDGESTFTQPYGSDTETTIQENDLVFVYGTLKKGYGNNRILSSSDYIGEATTKDKFIMGDVGFPYIFPESVVPTKYNWLLHEVKGEVYRVDSRTTGKRLDTLESYPSHYNRKKIETQCGKTVWVYYQEDFYMAKYCQTTTLTDNTWSWP